MQTYAAIVKHDPERRDYRIQIPALPGFCLRADARQELIARLGLAVSHYLREMYPRGQPIPKDDAALDDPIADPIYSVVVEHNQERIIISLATEFLQ